MKRFYDKIVIDVGGHIRLRRKDGLVEATCPSMARTCKIWCVKCGEPEESVDGWFSIGICEGIELVTKNLEDLR